jgi:hypothetical protein
MSGVGPVSSVTDQGSDGGGASDVELLGDGGFAQAFAGDVSDFLGLSGESWQICREGGLLYGLELCPAFTRSRRISRSNSASQHTGERSPARRRQVERLAQGDKSHLQRSQFLQGGMRSTSDRPQQSSRHTTMTSISLQRASRSNSFAPEPTSSTVNSIFQPLRSA